MRPTAIITSLHTLFFCWIGGIELGLMHTRHIETVRDAPYRAVMQQDIEDLKHFGIVVRSPETMPPLVPCDACLKQREAFGAYSDSLDGIVVPENFDVTSLNDRAILAHEYGHYLLTKAGVAAEQQEQICLALGNMVYRRYFEMASR